MNDCSGLVATASINDRFHALYRFFTSNKPKECLVSLGSVTSPLGVAAFQMIQKDQSSLLSILGVRALVGKSGTAPWVSPP